MSTASLIEREVDVIVVEKTIAGRAALRRTSATPIVMAIATDPIRSGLVANLAHPGGNITGLVVMTPELISKRLQLLREALPGATRAVVLWNPNNPFHTKGIPDFEARAHQV